MWQEEQSAAPGLNSIRPLPAVGTWHERHPAASESRFSPGRWDLWNMSTTARFGAEGSATAVGAPSVWHLAHPSRSTTGTPAIESEAASDLWHSRQERDIRAPVPGAVATVSMWWSWRNVFRPMGDFPSFGSRPTTWHFRHSSARKSCFLGGST